MKSKITDADGLSENLSDDTMVVLLITRREVESMDTGSLIERLHALTDTKDHVLQLRSSVVFQFSGYYNDPREFPEIQDVVQYMRAITKEWPHWLWFLYRGVGAISLLMSLLCNVRVEGKNSKNGGFGTAFSDVNQIRGTLVDLLERGSSLFIAFDIDDELINESARSAATEAFGLLETKS